MQFKFKITSHRGAGSLAPPNSLLGIKKAIDLGADIVEFDVRKTKDGAIILYHDPKIESKGKLEELCFKDVKDIIIGDNEKIPTLQQAIDSAKNNIVLQIELKSLGIAEDVCNIIKENNIEDSVIVTSFFHKNLKEIKKFNPEIQTGMLISARPLHIAPLIKACKADRLHIGNYFIDNELMKECNKLEIPVSAFNTHDLEELRRLNKLNVDTVGTDRPDLVIKWKNQFSDS